MGTLSLEDRETYQKLRSKGLLKDVEAHRIDMSQGVILVSCADGDQLHDIYANIAQTCLEHRPNPRVHTLTSHGGALILPVDSPLNKNHRGDNLAQDVCDAWDIKGIPIAALYAHAPCGAAARAGLSLVNVIDLLVRAKLVLKTEFLKRELPLKIACFMHIDRGPEEGKRTYFLRAAEWQLMRPREYTEHRRLKVAG